MLLAKLFRDEQDDKTPHHDTDLNLSSHAKVRSTHSRNEWMAALNNRFRPRFGVFRLRGFSLMFGMSLALKIALRLSCGLQSRPHVGQGNRAPGWAATARCSSLGCLPVSNR